jgi:hypothetical protein
MESSNSSSSNSSSSSSSREFSSKSKSETSTTSSGNNVINTSGQGIPEINKFNFNIIYVLIVLLPLCLLLVPFILKKWK